LEAVNPCLTTSFNAPFSEVPTAIENFVAFAGKIVPSTVKYTFRDEVSVLKTLSTDLNDFCEETSLAFSIEEINTTILQASNKDYIYLKPPLNSYKFGTFPAKVVATMDTYPLIPNASRDFTVTILGSFAPQIPNQVYVVNTTSLEIAIESFKVLPFSFNYGTSSIEAYLLNDKET